MTSHEARIALLILGAFAGAPASAAVCQPPAVDRESPYRYVLTLVDALTYAKSGLDRTMPAGVGAGSTDFDLLLGLKLGKADFECARAQVGPFTTSPNEAIQASAKGAAAVFSLLVNLQQRSVAEHTSLLDSMASGSVKPGTALERQAELAASYDDAWKRLIPAVIASTYAVVEVEPKTGLMSRLALTRAQRSEILIKLTSAFGEEVKRGMRAGQIPLTAAAAILYQVLADPQRKPRDSQ